MKIDSKIYLLASVVAVLVLFFLPGTLRAEIPLYAHCYDPELWDWTSETALEAETINLIRNNANLFIKNINYPGDASLFDNDPNIDLLHYLGFGNLYYGGIGGYIDPEDISKTTETNFYHSTDPSSLTAWRVVDGEDSWIQLHWTPDLRFVKGVHFDELSAPFPTGFVEEYIILRIANDDTTALSPLAGTSFEDHGAPDAEICSYSILSVSPIDNETTFPFSMDPVLVPIGVETVPHFWVEKTNYQEEIYDILNDIPGNPGFDWTFLFHVDIPIIPGNLSLEVCTENIDSVYNFNPILDPVYIEDIEDILTIKFEKSYNINDLLGRGGLVYRLKYDDPESGEEIFYPAEVDDHKHFFWSSVNNRVMGRNWLSYLMNIEGPTYLDHYISMVDTISQEIMPDWPAPPSTYDSIFMDSVLAMASDIHNVIRPYDYGGNTAYFNATEAGIKALCLEYSGLNFYSNTTSLPLLELLEGTTGFAGNMDENMTSQSVGWKELGQALWQFRGHPEWTNIFLNSFGFGASPDDREQALAGFLLARAPVSTSPNGPSTFGYGNWRDRPDGFEPNVNILPEQMIGFGDPLKDDPFPAEFPDAATWNNTYLASLPDFITELETNASAFIRDHVGSKFAVIELELNDGLDTEDNEVLVLWYLTEGPETIQVSIFDLFPEKVDRGQYFGLEIDIENVRLVDGGRVITKPYGVLDPFEMSREKVAIFFSAPISSPEIAQLAEYNLISDPSVTQLLAIRAEHWNGMQLEELRADCTDLGVPEEVILNDNGLNGDEYAGDGVYSSELIGLSKPNDVYEIPVVATGNDGLMYFGHTTVKVTLQTELAFVNGSALTGELATAGPDSLWPFASAAFDYNGDDLVDLFVTYRERSEINPLDQKARLFRRRGFIDGVPEFKDETPEAFMTGSEPYSNHTGIAITKEFGFNAPTIFLGHESTPRLYQWNAAEGQYEDVADTMFTVLPTESRDAAWEDYNNDGHMDLAVSRASGPAVSPHNRMTSLPFLYKNVPNGQGRSLELVPFGDLFPAEYMASYEVNWVDVDNQNGPDLFFTDLLSWGCSGLYLNQGPDAGFAFHSKTLDWFPQDDLPVQVMSAVFADFDDDDDMDLITASWAMEDNLKFYENSGSSFSIVNKTSRYVPTESHRLSGLVVDDFDNNSCVDVVVLPMNKTQKPYILLNGVSGDPGYFDRFIPVDLGVGYASSMAVADWGDDGDADLYIGREPRSDSFFYKNTLVDASGSIPFVKIDLLGGGGENKAGVGAKVEILNPGFETTKWVNNKRGRGASTLTLMFPLSGFSENTITVKTTWPSGHIQEQQCDVGVLTTINDDSYILDQDSIQSSYLPSPTSNNWVFEWTTKGPTLADQDFVYLEGPTDLLDPCYCHGNILLKPEMATVDVEIVKDGDVWHHTLTWYDGCCVVSRPPCTYNFIVSSACHTGVDISTYHEFVKTSICAFSQ